ncbi:MAG: RluA family pseudouridine synthase, partial [Saprospiraceae bacterium]|nr:RluA family pseudouridine synthase [Saprospiraceae bacterium]
MIHKLARLIVEDNNLELPPSNADNGDADLVEQQVFRADPGQSPVRLDKFLLDRLMQVSRNKIQNGIKSGAILVNGKEVKPNYKVRPNDKITLVTPRTSDKVPLVAEEMSLDIIFEDDDILIINKQPGLVVHPGVGNRQGTLVNGLIHHLDHSDLPLLKGNPSDRPGLVHRIDKDTSGLLVIAKNDYALSHLAKQFYHHSVERTYLALIWGQPEQASGMIND